SGRHLRSAGIAVTVVGSLMVGAAIALLVAIDTHGPKGADVPVAGPYALGFGIGGVATAIAGGALWHLGNGKLEQASILRNRQLSIALGPSRSLGFSVAYTF